MDGKKNCMILYAMYRNFFLTGKKIISRKLNFSCIPEDPAKMPQDNLSPKMLLQIFVRFAKAS